MEVLFYFVGFFFKKKIVNTDCFPGISADILCQNNLANYFDIARL